MDLQGSNLIDPQCIDPQWMQPLMMDLFAGGFLS